MIYWNTPKIIVRRFKRYVWHYPRTEKKLYLTFDDGPTPGVTNQVLDILDRYNAKATFFCLGRNVDRHSDILEDITSRGHAVGNHTYSHLKGWKSSLKSYVQDVDLAAIQIKSSLFRPPYGRIKKVQSKYLSKQYKIIMWDVLTHDYNRKLTEELCLRFALSSTKPGSIIVFHDSEKASRNLLYVLPRFLEHFTNEGYEFCKIV